VGNRKRMKNTFSTYAKKLTNYGIEVPRYLGSLTKIGTTFGIPLRTGEHLLQQPHYQYGLVDIFEESLLDGMEGT
jgi:hypothetical protein